MEKEFGRTFPASTLADLDRYEAVVKLLEDGTNKEPFRARMLPPIESRVGRRKKLIARSRERFATPRAVVEDKLEGWMAAASNPRLPKTRPTPKRGRMSGARSMPASSGMKPTPSGWMLSLRVPSSSGMVLSMNPTITISSPEFTPRPANGSGSRRPRSTSSRGIRAWSRATFILRHHGPLLLAGSGIPSRLAREFFQRQ